MVNAEPGGRRPSVASSVCGWLTLAIQIALGVAAIVFGWQGQFGRMALLLLGVALAAVPRLFARVVGLRMPAAVGLVTALFVFAALFLGTSLRFYDRYWWWDCGLHAASGFLLGFVGLVVLFLIDRSQLEPTRGRPALLAVFAFTFANTLGMAWEIFEYAGDALIPSSNMQLRQTGVHDTMIDLIMNFIGATVVSILVYLQARGSRRGFPLGSALVLVGQQRSTGAAGAGERRTRG